MSTVATRLDTETATRLTRAAGRLGLKPADLLRVGIHRLLDEVEREGGLILPLPTGTAGDDESPEPEEQGGASAGSSPAAVKPAAAASSGAGTGARRNTKTKSKNNKKGTQAA